MNCTRARKLLPLHAAGDLEGRPARAISAHLIGCDECRCLAAEYEQSRSWLGGAAAPEFDEEFFAELRGAVRREAARERAQPEPRSAFAPSIGWRPLVAAAALLLLLGGLPAYRSPDRRRPNAAQDEQLVRDQANEGGKPTSPDKAVARQERPRPPQTQTTRKRLRRGPPGSTQPAPNLIAQEPRAASGESESAAQADSGASAEALRIEIQTADPNIRIIWFAPQETTATAARAAAETR